MAQIVHSGQGGICNLYFCELINSDWTWLIPEKVLEPETLFLHMHPHFWACSVAELVLLTSFHPKEKLCHVHFRICTAVLCIGNKGRKLI